MKEENFKDKYAIFYTIGKGNLFAVMRDDAMAIRDKSMRWQEWKK